MHKISGLRSLEYVLDLKIMINWRKDKKSLIKVDRVWVLGKQTRTSNLNIPVQMAELNCWEEE